jgi:hypothetical protein
MTSTELWSGRRAWEDPTESVSYVSQVAYKQDAESPAARGHVASRCSAHPYTTCRSTIGNLPDSAAVSVEGGLASPLTRRFRDLKPSETSRRLWTNPLGVTRPVIRQPISSLDFLYTANSIILCAPLIRSCSAWATTVFPVVAAVS